MDSTTPSTSRLDPLIEALLIILLAFLPAAIGAVDSWAESIGIMIGSIIAVLLAIRITLAKTWLVRPTLAWAAIALFVAASAGQLIPIKRGIFKKISPHTAGLRSDLLHDLPNANDVLSHQAISFYPHATMHDLRIVLLAITVFATVSVIYRDGARIRRLLVAIALIGGACAALAAAQDATRTTQIYWKIPIGEPARSGPFVNHSHFGQFMNLCIGAALALLLSTLPTIAWLPLWTRLRRVGWIGAIIVGGLATITLSLTRGGMVAIVVSGAFAVTALLSTGRLRRMVGVVLVLALLAGGLISYVGFDRIYNRVIEPGGVGSRAQMIRDVGGIVRIFPIFGTGLGTFEWVYPMYDRTLSQTTATHLENEYLQALMETGVVGALAIAVFLLSLAFAYVRAVRHSDSRIGLAAVGLGFGLIAVMVHSLSDFGQHMPAVGCMSAALCALLINLVPSERREFAIPRVLRLAMVIAVGIVGAWAIRDSLASWRAAQRWDDVTALATSLDEKADNSDEGYQNVIALADSAVAADPANVYFRYWSAVHRWSWVSSKRNPDTNAVLVTPQSVAQAQLVIDELNEAREHCPTFGRTYTLLGQIEYKFLDRPVGIAHIRTGYKLARNDAVACFLAGQMDVEAGKFASAEERFHEAMLLDWSMVDSIIDVYLYQAARPDLAIAGVGNDYMGLIQLRDSFRENPAWANLAADAEKRAFDVLRAEIDIGREQRTSLIAHLGAFYGDHGSYEAAEKYLTRALEAEPNQIDWQIRLIDVLEKVGKKDQAIQLARTAVQQHPESAPAQAALKRLTGS